MRHNPLLLLMLVVPLVNDKSNGLHVSEGTRMSTNMDHLILEAIGKATVECMHKGSVIPAGICRVLHEVNKISVSIMIIPHAQGLKLPLRHRGQMWITEHLCEFGNELKPIGEDTWVDQHKEEGLKPGCCCLSKI